jgi:hypothetical protein
MLTFPPSAVNEILQNIMKNTQNLPEMKITLDNLNSRHILYELGTNVIKTRVQELSE